jgi:hypothetical protein
MDVTELASAETVLRYRTGFVSLENTYNLGWESSGLLVNNGRVVDWLTFELPRDGVTIEEIEDVTAHYVAVVNPVLQGL